MTDTGPTIGLVRHFALQLRTRTNRTVVDEVIAAVDMPDPLTADTDTRIPLVNEAAFIEAACAACGDIDFAFTEGVKLSFATSLPAYISEHSKTLRDALVDATRFLPLVRPGLPFVLQESGNVGVLSSTIEDPVLLQYPRHIEAIYAGVIGQVRAFTARPFHPETLSFRHIRREASREATAALGVSVAFGAEQDEMLISTNALDRPIARHDDALRGLLVHHGELLNADAERHGLSFAERVELAIQHALPGSLPKADDIARDLGVSRRTLSRRLAETGTSVGDILSRVRIQVASHQLRDSDTQIAEIAWTLGYANQSAFSTAFRRAVGLSPREFREQARDSAQ